VPLLVCTVGLGLYPPLMALVPSQAWLPPVAVVQGFFIAGVDLAFFDALLAVCPAERRPTYIALNTTLYSLVMFLAPMLGSLLADWVSIRAVFWVTGALHVAGAILFWRLRIAAE
jgi:MFS family permease